MVQCNMNSIWQRCFTNNDAAHLQSLNFFGSARGGGDPPVTDPVRVPDCLFVRAAATLLSMGFQNILKYKQWEQHIDCSIVPEALRVYLSQDSMPGAGAEAGGPQRTGKDAFNGP